MKRRKRSVPGRSSEGKKVMIYLYEDEYNVIRKAAIKRGSSISGYVSTVAIDKAKEELAS